MTNDDRSNEDRPGDGQAPNWGSSPGSAPADEPRYGERAEPTSTPQYGEQAPAAPQYGQPQYGEQAQAAPQYGSEQYREQQGQYGQAQYGQQPQPYAAPAPTSAGAPAWQSYDEPKRKKRTVGVIAFLVGVLALVVGVVSAVLFGSAFAGSAALDEAASGSTELSQSAMEELLRSPGAVAASLLFYLATALGLWAIVQGIVAAVTKRGRAWGVWAIVLAVVAFIVFLIALGVSVAGAAGSSV